MQQIHIQRYQSGEVNGVASQYQGSIEPEDRSWIVFVAHDGKPSLWLQVETESDDGKTVHGYVNVEDVPGFPDKTLAETSPTE